MVPQLIARVDGLPELVAPERVWPDPTTPAKDARGTARRERDARQAAVVQHARLPRWARHMLAVQELDEEREEREERREIRAELAKAGLL